jgi:hypothetical protein
MDSPQKLSWNSKEEDVHTISEILGRQIWTDCDNVRRELMIRQIHGVPLVFVEVLDNALLTSPQINVVLHVPQMRSEARTKVSCAKNENP